VKVWWVFKRYIDSFVKYTPSFSPFPFCVVTSHSAAVELALNSGRLRCTGIEIGSSEWVFLHFLRDHELQIT
jgi:hypothetical protein